jgi:hypothetical protein
MPKHGEQNVGHIGCRQDVDRNGLPVSCLLSPPIATIQRTSGEVRFVLFRKWDRHYSIASAARTVPRVRLTPRGCLLTLNRQRSGSLFRASRPLLPGSNALLNIGRRSPRADIASAGWKCL